MIVMSVKLDKISEQIIRVVSATFVVSAINLFSFGSGDSIMNYITIAFASAGIVTLILSKHIASYIIRR